MRGRPDCRARCHRDARHRLAGRLGGRRLDIRHLRAHSRRSHSSDLQRRVALGIRITGRARRFGPLRFLVFMATTAAAGAAVHLVTHFGELLPMIGASASISGAMAAAMRFAFQRGGPLALWRDREEAYRVPAAPLTSSLRDPRVLAFLLIWFGVNLLFRLGSISMAGVEQVIAWQAHIGGFLAGLMAFAAFDPIPVSTGAGPSEAWTRRPPAINLDAIAGRALLAMPRRSTHRSGCACEGGVRGDRVRGGHHLVQTA